MKTPILLSNSDISEISRQMGLDAQMDGLIERLERAFCEYDQKTCDIPTRDGFHYEKPYIGLVEWMPLMLRGKSIMMKMVGYHPENPTIHKLPTILSAISLFDAHTGQLKVMADGTFLTALRTGAASAVASRILADPESGTIGLIGTGAQAMAQLHAISRVFPIKKALIFDNNPTVARSFLGRIAPLGMDSISISVEPLERVVSEADILCIATTVGKNQGPVFQDSIPIKRGLHINAVGSDLPGKTEVPVGHLKRSFVCPDFRPQALIEGECQQLEVTEVGPELHQLVKNRSHYRGKQKELTVFDSTGFALEDHVVLEYFLELSIRFGIGTPLDLNNVPEDPYNTYESVFSSTGRDKKESQKHFLTSFGV
ncbi:MAG: ornithine cyclodeaminase family protein [Verrucomicrobia bacterium]|nr:ornithine cyclodeaminase family protein [Verrucomicrobiota bacterium]